MSLAAGGGGFGAGAGGFGRNDGGGGGLGAGGDVFIQQGATVTIEGGSYLADGSVSGGHGGSVVDGGAGPDGDPGGYNYGTGIFLQGDQSLNLAAAAGQTTMIAGVISDQSGSGGVGTGAGAGSLLINAGADLPTGTVLLEAVNTYTGDTEVDSGVLALGPEASIASSSAVKISGGAALDVSAGTSGVTLFNLQDLSGGAGPSHLYLGAQTLTLEENTDETFSGVIADTGGASGGAGGALVVNGPTGASTTPGTGTLSLAGSSTFTGGVILAAGGLHLEHANAAGTGVITLAAAPAASVTLVIDQAALTTVGGVANTLANPVNGLGAGFAHENTIDLDTLAYGAGATATVGGGGLLTVSSGATTDHFSTDLATGTPLSVASDGAGGTVIAIDHAAGPTLTLGSATTVEAVQGGAALQVFTSSPLAGYSASDGATSLTGATVSLGPSYQAGDALNVAITGTNIVVEGDADGVLTLSGTDTAAHYDQVLQSLTYQDGGVDPTDGANPTRTLQVTVRDPLVESAPETTVISTDRPPTANRDYAGTLPAQGASISGNVLSNDADLDHDSLAVTRIESGSGPTVAVAGTALAHGIYGDVTIHSDGSYIYTAGATAAQQNALASAPSGSNLSDAFTYTVNDGHGGNSSALLKVGGISDLLFPTSLRHTITPRDRAP